MKQLLLCAGIIFLLSLLIGVSATSDTCYQEYSANFTPISCFGGNWFCHMRTKGILDFGTDCPTACYSFFITSNDDALSGSVSVGCCTGTNRQRSTGTIGYDSATGQFILTYGNEGKYRLINFKEFGEIE